MKGDTISVTAKKCTGKKLAEVLRKTPLSVENALVWRKDLIHARKILKPAVVKKVTHPVELR
jgi:hypothetical protein